jgi:hypothetical protein
VFIDEFERGLAGCAVFVGVGDGDELALGGEVKGRAELLERAAQGDWVGAVEVGQERLRRVAKAAMRAKSSQGAAAPLGPQPTS